MGDLEFERNLALWKRGAHAAEHGQSLPDDEYALRYYLEVSEKLRVLGPALVIAHRLESLEAARLAFEDRIAADAKRRRRIIDEANELAASLTIGRAA